MEQREVKQELGRNYWDLLYRCTFKKNRWIKKNKIINESNKAVTEENAITFFYDEN